MIDLATLMLNRRYKGFHYLAKSQLFNELFHDQNFDAVQIHDANYLDINGEKIITGFCGAFEWKNNKLVPLDYDTYTEKMPVIAYKEFSHKGKKCLDILVESW